MQNNPKLFYLFSKSFEVISCAGVPYPRGQQPASVSFLPYVLLPSLSYFFILLELAHIFRLPEVAIPAIISKLKLLIFGLFAPGSSNQSFWLYFYYKHSRLSYNAN